MNAYVTSHMTSYVFSANTWLSDVWFGMLKLYVKMNDRAIRPKRMTGQSDQNKENYWWSLAHSTYR